MREMLFRRRLGEACILVGEAGDVIWLFRSPKQPYGLKSNLK